MSFFSFLNIFNKTSVKQKHNADNDYDENTPLKGTQLFFDNTLIKNLQSDHEDLLHIYGEIAKALQDNNQDALLKLFTKFSSTLRSHLLKENLKLYIYLSHALKDDPQSLATVNELKTEMQQIGRSVNDFLSRYSEMPWTQEKMQSFPVEFKKTGEILVDRIKREEQNLYPLYMHPDAYSDASKIS